MIQMSNIGFYLFSYGKNHAIGHTQKTKWAFEGAEGVIEAFSSFSYQESYLD